jgi:pteridine reductase
MPEPITPPVTISQPGPSVAEREHLAWLFGHPQPVAWVTGSAADRVGRVIARRFAERGYRLVLHARRSAQEGEDLVARWRGEGIDCRLVVGSIEDEGTVRGWIQEILQGYGRLDVLVHSAAVWEPCKLEETTAEVIARQWSSNTLGTFLCAQQAGLAMVRQATGGGIVLVGDWAIRRPYADFAAYFASKGSIPTIMRAMAVELAERNPRVRVNAVYPGPVLLDPNTSEATQARILEQCLLRCHGTAEHVARAAVFLAEHDFMTGVGLPVDGGRSIYAGSIADAIAHPSRLGAADTAPP